MRPIEHDDAGDMVKRCMTVEIAGTRQSWWDRIKENMTSMWLSQQSGTAASGQPQFTWKMSVK